MKKGEIYAYPWAEWPEDDPIPCPKKALIIQNNTSNTYFPRVIVVPLIIPSIKVKYPMQFDISLRGQKIRALCDRMETIEKKELGCLLGSLAEKEMITLDRCLAVSVGIIGWRDRHDPTRSETVD